MRVTMEHERLRPKKTRPGKGGATKKTRVNNQIKALKRDVAKAKRQVAAIKRGNDDEEEDEKAPDDAGNQFGGRAEKKKQKKNKD